MTTTLDLNFSLSGSGSRVFFAAVGAPMSSNSLAPNITSVQFAKGSGQIIYNDRPPIPELFSDPSPYQIYIDQWMTALASATPALTLAQAQAAKVSFLNGVYAVKRQTAVSVSVGGTAYSWDASDLAVGRMAALAGFLVGQNGVLKQLVSDLNVWASHFNTFASNTQSTFNTLVSEINTQLTNIEYYLPPPGIGQPVYGTISGVTDSYANDASLTESFSSASSAASQLIPLNATAPVTLALSDLQNILTAIAVQNISTQQTFLTKQAAINALGTIAAVAAYDTTTGW